MNAKTGKTYTTAVVLIPPEDVWEPIQKLRRVYDRHFDRWMPHLTLLYPFAERQEFPQVIPILATATAKVEPFRLRLARFDHFRHQRSCTIFLLPDPESHVINLHASLIEATPDYNDTTKYAGGFHPHLSIGQFQHQSVQQDEQRLQSEWTPIQFEVKQISVIYRAPETGERFVVSETLTLGSAKTYAVPALNKAK